MNPVSSCDIVFCHDYLQDLTKVDKNHWSSLVFRCLNFLEEGDEGGRVIWSLTIGYNHLRSSLPNGSFWSIQSVMLICKVVVTYQNKVTLGDAKSFISFLDLIGNLVAASNENCVRLFIEDEYLESEINQDMLAIIQTIHEHETVMTTDNPGIDHPRTT
ncbi:hypothetical protein V6N13_129560 [Hibiscus sabdariffa]|uniref:Uncharacterized protein n=1 Tax=Hibiscus sabdariffa TaxID=183260 RepID=A0ABR2SLI9_9ROSI